MNATIETRNQAPNGGVARGIGLHGGVALSWAMASGILWGGIVVALMTLSGNLSANALFLSATGLFLMGAVLGIAHGGLLGFLGRADHVSPERAGRDIGMALLYSVIGLAVAWLVSVWIAMTVVARYTQTMGAWLGVGLGWAAGVAVVATAAVLGWRAFSNAYARWEDRRVGTLLVGATFAALLILFLAERPEIWLIHLRVTAVGAVLLAAFATIWVAGPIITVGLKAVREIPWTRRPVAIGRGWQGVTDMGLGLGVGLAVGLLALPFTAATHGATGGGFLAAISQALVNEVLLRLFLTTAVLWLVLRWHRIHTEEAALVSVLGAAAMQVLLYLPGVVGIGFSTGFAAITFAVVGVLLPAVAFGLLYVTRGFVTALLADATALGMLALVAI